MKWSDGGWGDTSIAKDLSSVFRTHDEEEEKRE